MTERQTAQIYLRADILAQARADFLTVSPGAGPKAHNRTVANERIWQAFVGNPQDPKAETITACRMAIYLAAQTDNLPLGEKGNEAGKVNPHQLERLGFAPPSHRREMEARIRIAQTITEATGLVSSPQIALAIRIATREAIEALDKIDAGAQEIIQGEAVPLINPAALTSDIIATEVGQSGLVESLATASETVPAIIDDISNRVNQKIIPLAWYNWLSQHNGSQDYELAVWTGLGPIRSFAHSDGFREDPCWQIPSPTLRHLLGNPHDQEIPQIVSGILAPKENDPVVTVPTQVLTEELQKLAQNSEAYVATYINTSGELGLDYQAAQTIARQILERVSAFQTESETDLFITQERIIRIIISCLLIPNEYGDSWGWADTDGSENKQLILPDDESLTMRVSETIANEESWLKTPIPRDFFAQQAQTAYQRILPANAEAGIGRDLTESEFASLNPAEQTNYVTVETRRVFYDVPRSQIVSLNQKAQACAANGEPLTVFMPSCPYNPYMFDSEAGMIRPVPGRPVIPEGMNHTGYTSLFGSTPFIQSLLSYNGLSVNINVGTGAEEWEQGRTRGMSRTSFRKALDGNHPFTVQMIAAALGQEVSPDQIDKGPENDLIHPYSIGNLKNGTLSISADSLTGLAGGSETWASIETRAQALTDTFFSKKHNQSLVERAKEARKRYYTYVLAVRAGIMKTWDSKNAPDYIDYAKFLYKHYQEKITQQRAASSSQVSRQEIEGQFDHDLTQELKSDVTYYATFHLMARERWGENRLVILAADSRPLHALASNIAGTRDCLLMIYGNYEGADFTNGHSQQK
ncbi:MAG: hypothetical protein JW991_03320 [Candidatus Pacebacteria bacterium]|nr:hypothetical protein [Candidatus Paceibacterota bacterium]